MGANFGVLPPLPERIRDKRQRYICLLYTSILLWELARAEEKEGFCG